MVLIRAQGCVKFVSTNTEFRCACQTVSIEINTNKQDFPPLVEDNARPRPGKRVSAKNQSQAVRLSPELFIPTPRQPKI